MFALKLQYRRSENLCPFAFLIKSLGPLRNSWELFKTAASRPLRKPLRSCKMRSNKIQSASSALLIRGGSGKHTAELLTKQLFQYSGKVINSSLYRKGELSLGLSTIFCSPKDSMWNSQVSFLNRISRLRLLISREYMPRFPACSPKCLISCT